MNEEDTPFDMWVSWAAIALVAGIIIGLTITNGVLWDWLSSLLWQQ